MNLLTRRAFAAALGATALTVPAGRSLAAPDDADLAHLSPEQQKAYRDYVARMWKAFPYRHVSVAGRDALAKWSRIRAEGKVWPVIVGGEAGLEDLADGYTMLDPEVAGSPRLRERPPSAAEILAAAAGFAFPPAPGQSADEPVAPLGDWPATPVASPGLSIAADLDGRTLDRVHILLIPTRSSWEVPAYLRWGGWNACPPPHHQVAALRSWHERFGAELVAIDRDTMNIRTKRRPSSRAQALALAEEHYRHCPDVVDQGVGSISALAASLLANDWWFFWWD